MSIGNNSPVASGPQPAGRNWKAMGLVAAASVSLTVVAGMWAFSGSTDQATVQSAPQRLAPDPGHVEKEKEVVIVREPEQKPVEQAPQAQQAPQQKATPAAPEFVSMFSGVNVAGKGYSVERVPTTSGRGVLPAAAGGEPPRRTADGVAGKSFVIDDYRDSPGPNTIRRGDLLSGMSLDEFSTDQGGPFRMLFNDPVYDSATQSVVLIPAGATIYCVGSKEVEYGQDRGAAKCDMIIMPDNSHVPLGEMQATAENGSVGLNGDVNHHRGPLLLGIGAQVIGSMLQSAGQAFGQSGEQTVVNVGVGAAGQGASTAIDKIMEQEIKRRNTITVHPGDPMGVRMESFLVMRPWRR